MGERISPAEAKLPQTVARYWHTLRHLKPVQFYGRAWAKLHRPRVIVAPAGERRRNWASWVPCARTASMTGADRFCFLGVERCIAWAEDWDRPDWPKLWRYNLHYFDDLVASDANLRRAWHREHIQRWIGENPPAQGSGWEPYPVSLRIVNWVKWALSENVLDDEAMLSLAVQARWLTQRLELHLLGNHLWANGKALVFAGSYFEGTEAAAWRRQGCEIVREQLREQVLEDGGHFERSPMYHAIVLEDLLDLIQLAQVYPKLYEESEVLDWKTKAVKMLHWLRVMSHPDGEIAFFNDAAIGIAPPYEALRKYALALALPWEEPAIDGVTKLSASGYLRLQCGEALVLADLAPVGPDYLPGHAHADTLSFEFSLGGQRVFVNGGTSTYEPGPERQRQRGTAAHNTVEVDGENSSEVWAGFRVARRARPLKVSVVGTANRLCAGGAHDGYLRLPGKVVHRRAWQLGAECLEVVDDLTGLANAAVARFHLHPDAKITPESTIQLLDGRTIYWSCLGGSASIEADTWHPQFGRSVASQCLAIRFSGSRIEVRFRWG
ncbi:MAG: alginate lyase family protein [Betaproteobacteria bacterium]|nr:alginate lyase family protein [Betaproteobacteria bacterium]